MDRILVTGDACDLLPELGRGPRPSGSSRLTFIAALTRCLSGRA